MRFTLDEQYRERLIMELFVIGVDRLSASSIIAASENGEVSGIFLKAYKGLKLRIAIEEIEREKIALAKQREEIERKISNIKLNNEACSTRQRRNSRITQI
jgi:hypothetical protein